MLTRNLFLLACLAIAIGGCSEQKAPLVNNQSGFEIKTLSGETKKVSVKPSDGRFNDLIIDSGGDKPVIFSFFTTTCPECAKKFPHMIDMQNRYKDQIVLLGVLVENKTVEEIADFAQFHQLNYPIVLGAGAFRLADAVGGVRMIPATHIYEGNGKYTTHFVGAVPQEMLETRIDSILKAQ
ncbi:MAG: TlpA family protein disulfide reductase [Helicobacteraceae bacterium]|jgi:thioredoxin-like negative regulator of GroEL|nr:TlpA family protein disulfide reductase [Helicobacteraceae bacterium]